MAKKRKLSQIYYRRSVIKDLKYCGINVNHGNFSNNEIKEIIINATGETKLWYKNAKAVIRWFYENKASVNVKKVGTKKDNTPTAKIKKKKRVEFCQTKDFLQSYEWRKLRYEALKNNNGKCELCGKGKSDRIVLHVDHIKPRKKNPELALELSNLQVLCNECNHGKGNWDQTDWRGI